MLHYEHFMLTVFALYLISNWTVTKAETLLLVLIG